MGHGFTTRKSQSAVLQGSAGLQAGCSEGVHALTVEAPGFSPVTGVCTFSSDPPGILEVHKSLGHTRVEASGFSQALARRPDGLPSLGL